jgi:hypothetical protein
MFSMGTDLHARSAPRKARLVAFYLPQFHPIPENDEWWGKGFTEWTNVAKAKPLFPGHYQPRVPAELGFYDLRLPETRVAQAKLARDAGIEGFCYWHYWFAGTRLLERPFNEVLSGGEPDFPFCLAWANQTWTGIWHGAANRILIEQTYPGRQDHERHFHAVLPAFHDPRYIRVRDKPLFVIYRPAELPDLPAFIEQWQTLALRNGLKGIHFVAHIIPQDGHLDCDQAGFSGAVHVAALKVSSLSLPKVIAKRIAIMVESGENRKRISEVLRNARRLCHYAGRKARQRMLGRPLWIYDYEDALLFLLDGVQPKPTCYPCVIPNWDNSPRSGYRGLILHGSTPELFRQHVREAMQSVENRHPEDRIVFVKSWNEWAEGNYLEPDQRFGRQYLNVLHEEVFSQSGLPDSNGASTEPAHKRVESAAAQPS